MSNRVWPQIPVFSTKSAKYALRKARALCLPISKYQIRNIFAIKCKASTLSFTLYNSHSVSVTFEEFQLGFFHHFLLSALSLSLSGLAQSKHACQSCVTALPVCSSKHISADDLHAICCTRTVDRGCAAAGLMRSTISVHSLHVSPVHLSISPHCFFPVLPFHNYDLRLTFQLLWPLASLLLADWDYYSVVMWPAGQRRVLICKCGSTSIHTLHCLCVLSASRA